VEESAVSYWGYSRMKQWVMRIVGVLNLLCSVLGIFYFAIQLSWHWHRWPGAPSFFDWLVFLALSAVNISLVVYLGFLGVRLLRKDRAAIRSTSIVLAIELIYFFASTVLFWLILPPSKASLTIGFWGMAQDPLAPQILTAYPLIGLVVTLLLLRSSGRQMNT
jgi:hypothetical protein